MADLIPKNSGDPKALAWSCEGCSKAMKAQPVYDKVVKDKPVAIKDWNAAKSWDVQVPRADGQAVVYKTCSQECARNVYLVRGMDEAFKRLLARR